MKQIINKYLNGQANKDEQDRLLEHLRQSDTNKQQFTGIKEEWKNSDKEVLLPVKSAWNSLLVQLHTTKETGRRWQNRALAIASVIIVFLVVSTALLVERIITQTVSLRTELGQNVNVLLPDSSVVYMNEQSTLSYNALLFGFMRKVEMTGEAYFDVKKQQSSNFKVRTGDLQIQVLGTQFNVDASNSSEMIDVLLDEGRVELTLTNDDSFRHILEPGQRASIYLAEKTCHLEQVKPSSMPYWYKQKLSFKDQPIKDFFKELAKKYGFSYELSDEPELHDLNITLTIKDEKLEDVFEIVELTLPVIINSENKVIEVKLDKKRYQTMKQ